MPLLFHEGFVLKTGGFRWLSFSLFLVSSNNNQRSGFFFSPYPLVFQKKKKESPPDRSLFKQRATHVIGKKTVFILGQEFCPNFWSNRRYESKGLRLKLRRLVHVILSSEETKMTRLESSSLKTFPVLHMHHYFPFDFPEHRFFLLQF